MSDAIKHECGIALLRLKKPLNYYQEKYGTPFWGINKMYLLMEKQHNRGQDGAGIANIKLDMPAGTRYISRKRSNANQPIQEIIESINGRFKEASEKHPEKINDVNWLKDNLPFTGELFLGHLRYGTYGGNSIEHCHPFLRQNNWKTRNLVVAGNFNLTNTDELFSLLVEIGQSPKEKTDTVTVMEKIGHYLDVENQFLFDQYKKEGKTNFEISHLIADNMNVQRILKNAAIEFDGGYAMAGLIGHGDAFVLRDPNGIRPAFWYENDEIVVVASERPVIQTAFKVELEKIQEVKPGHAIIIKKNGNVSEQEVLTPKERKACSFERIYFSRGSDADIYRERIMLGSLVFDKVLPAINYDLHNTVFSYIPNTAEIAFYGLIKRAEDHINQHKKEKILALGAKVTPEQLDEILSMRARIEKLAIKDAKLRTFITQDADRDEMVAHVYDITYGTVKKDADTLVVIDDSIVRGTTLKKSILKMLDRLHPKKIIIVSSAPQIRYPDCYGIDMAKLADFIAFQAAVELLKEQGKESILQSVYEKCKADLTKPKEEVINRVKEVYKPFTAEEISAKISELLHPKDIKAEVQIIYQSIEGLHQACPNHTGDWYFTGDYPTHGGNKVVNKAFINYMEKNNERAY